MDFNQDFHDRLKNLFFGPDPDLAREKRMNGQVELRKNKRLELTYKKRNLKGLDLEWINIEKLPAEDYSPDKIEEYLMCLKHDNKKVNLAGVYGLRRIISNPKITSFDFIFHSEVLNLIPAFMYLDSFPQLQYETAWLVGNLFTGSSSEIESLINHGCFSGLTYMLNSSITEVKEQAFWALGNMATDSSKFRDLLLEASVFSNLVKIVMSLNTPVRLLKQGCWTLSSICRIKPVPSMNHCESLVVPLTKGLLMHKEIKESTEDVMLAIISITDAFPVLISRFNDKDVVQTFMQFLYMGQARLTVLALKVVGNFIASDDCHTDVVIRAGVLKAFAVLAKSEDLEVRREVFLSISNLCAGNYLQLEALWNSGLIKLLFNDIQKQPFEILRDISWSLYNLSCNNFLYLEESIQEGLFTSFSHLLNTKESKILRVALTSLSKVLEQVSENADFHLILLNSLQSCDLFNILSNLQQSKNSEISNLSSKLLEAYFDRDSEYDSLITNIEEFSNYHI
jgi:hypothetical protein